jgi:CRP-like cAMP-binding protein
MPFFRDLSPIVVISLAEILQEKKYKIGEYILKTGEAIDKFYLVANGEVSVAISRIKSRLF